MLVEVYLQLLFMRSFPYSVFVVEFACNSTMTASSVRYRYSEVCAVLGEM